MKNKTLAIYFALFFSAFAQSQYCHAGDEETLLQMFDETAGLTVLDMSQSQASEATPAAVGADECKCLFSVRAQLNAQILQSDTLYSVADQMTAKLSWYKLQGALRTKKAESLKVGLESLALFDRFLGRSCPN